MDADIFVDYIYELLRHITKVWSIVQPFLLLQYPYQRELAIAGNSIAGALNVYTSTGGSQFYWVHELVLVVICTFGGGLITPILLGKPSIVLNNDVIVFCCIVAWYTVFYLKGHSWLNYPPIKTVWLVFLGLFRTAAVTNMVQLAYGTLMPTAYYPIPVFGPIISGTLVGSLGMFLPFDKGLAAIKNNGPWPLQAAFYTATFYHFMVNDSEGFIGVTLRQIFGHLSRQTVLTIIALVQVTHLLLHYFLSPEANLFTPFHKLLYLIFQVNGPTVIQKPALNGIAPAVGWDAAARKKTRILIDILRVVLVGLVVIGHVYFHISPLKIKTEYLPWDMTHLTSPLTPLSTTPPAGTTSSNSVSSLLSGLFGSKSATTTPTAADTKSINQKLGVIQKLVLSEKEFESFAIHALAMNESIGSCQYFTSFRRCSPYLARLEQATCADEVDLPYPYAPLITETTTESIVHPFCNTKDKNYSPTNEIYRLAVYNVSAYRYLVPSKQGSFAHASPVYSIPLSTVNLFDTKEFEILHQNKSLLHHAPSLHISLDGWIVLLKPIRIVGHSVTILYNHIGSLEGIAPVVPDTESSSKGEGEQKSQETVVGHPLSGYCGYLPQTVAANNLDTVLSNGKYSNKNKANPSNSLEEKKNSQRIEATVQAVQFAKNGQLVASCAQLKKDEL